MKPVAIITGATDGIGKAAAAELLRRGWKVGIVGRNASRCVAVERELGGDCSSMVADLSRMDAVVAASDTLAARYPQIDALLLNANAIQQQRLLTADGFESNLAIGFLGRVLLLRRLAPLLAVRPDAQILSVIGLDHQRLDFEDPQLGRNYSARAALMRWQWAIQMYAREHNRRNQVGMNSFMPGLVRTKILASEPQPMRLIVQLANRIVGIPVEQSGAELAQVVEQVRAKDCRDAYFNRQKLASPRNLRDLPGDGERVWALAERLLAPWLAPKS